MNKRSLLVAAALILTVQFPLHASDAYPNRPIKLVVTYPPGGASDLMARIFGERLAEEFGQTVVIENKAGAGGSLGVWAAESCRARKVD